MASPLHIAALLILAATTGAGAIQGTADPSVFPLHIVRDTGAVAGTCVLVHREDRNDGSVLYFLTASRLFKTPDGESEPAPRTMHVLIDGGRRLELRREDVFVPMGNMVDIAILRATTTSTTPTPRSMVFEPPPAGDGFFISGYDGEGASLTVTERIRFESTRFVVGDRGALALAGCLGAPAISRQGAVFGIVSECNVNSVPVISVLWVARSFIARHVPTGRTDP